MQEAVVIKGQCRLNGKIKIDGSKNAALALIPAALLCRDVVRLENVPHIDDVAALIELLNNLNVKVEQENSTLIIDSRHIINVPLLKEQVSKIRASYYFMGVLIALFDEVTIAHPGGCHIGDRPIDIHLKMFNELGIAIEQKNELYHLKKHSLVPHTIRLPKASVGATINLMLAASGCTGMTIIENGAQEPEVAEVAVLLSKMGILVNGVGTGRMTIQGGFSLTGTSHRIIPDRIEAGSYLIFGAALADELEVTDLEPLHLQSLLRLFSSMGIKMQIGKTAIRIFGSRPSPISVVTAPYPGFPTDLQQPLTTLMTLANGLSKIQETIYPDRVAHIYELEKMGAVISAEGNIITVRGGNSLRGARVSAKDLRGGASLLLAGMIAEGDSVLTGIRFIKRGYGNFITKLNNCGANIRLIEVDDE